VFRTATKGMEDALVGFVKTGKFEWRSFVADILEQLLRAQIQQGIASLGASLGLGNLFGAPGGGGAAANTRGATPTSPLFVQDVAGSSGITGGLNAQQAAMTQQTQSIFSRMGEVMSTIGSYLGGAMKSISGVISILVGSLSGIMGSVIKGMGSALSGIGSMIMSLVRSIVSMFGGYFADGGVLPRGQFGIVGERGPEIITGPATVTPMSGIGGGTQVIYNINAVDARSFQQLLAQDPGLIFALTEQGRKSLAGSRR
jgi:phage-related minor tail protein